MDQLVHNRGLPDLDCLVLAYETSRDCIATLALDGTLLAVNRAGADAMGIAPTGGVGRHWGDLWLGTDRAAARAAIIEAGRCGRAIAQTAQATAAGAFRVWDTVITVVPTADGVPRRLLAVSRDMTAQYEADRALDHSMRLQKALIEATSEIIWHVDTRTGVTARRGYSDFTGQPDDPDDLDGWLAAVHPDDKARAKGAADLALTEPRAFTIEYRMLHHTGTWRWVEDHASPIFSDHGSVTDWVGIITDIHDRKCAEKALQKNAEHLRLAVEATGLGSWDINMLTGEREWSAEMFDLLRLPRDTVPDRALFLACIHPDDRARVDRELVSLNGPDEPTQVSVFRYLFADGEERWIEAHKRTFFGPDGKPSRRVGTVQDITDRKQAEREVWRAAHTDALTGVSNRTLFQSRLERAVGDAEAGSPGVGLILVDLDRFKEINDTLGHDAGDTLLRTVAERLTANVDGTATVARLGGDEFGILLPGIAGVAVIGALATALLEALKQPLLYAGREVDCSVSVGWSVYPSHDGKASTILKNADIALYAAKSAGRGRALAYEPAMRDELQRRVNVLRSAKEALARDAVIPFYQPKISLESGAVVGFEALLRWTDARGLQPPSAIQGALDDPELSIQLGARMLERAVADMRGWTADRVPFGHVALNVAAPEFMGPCFSKRILGALEAARLQPHRLEIEVTERVLLDDGSEAIGTALRRLHDAGIKIALDDFGTGYASLTHLTKFPVAFVKIDRSFVMNLLSDSNAAAIAIAVIDLAHKTGIKAVAEGIETREQLTLLARHGCDLGQGFLLAKPMNASRIPFFLKEWSSRLRFGSAMRRYADGREHGAGI